MVDPAANGRAFDDDLIAIGSGPGGQRAAIMFASLGVRVTLIDKRPRLLPDIDTEIMDALAFHLRRNRMTLWLGDEVSGLDLDEDDDGKVRIHLASGKHIVAEKALYAIGRSGATASLDLEAAGLAADDRGRLAVDEHYRTAVPHLRGRRRDRLPQPRLDLARAGPPGRATRSTSPPAASRRWCPTPSTRSPRSRRWGAARRS